jgi:hypothetical protein
LLGFDPQNFRGSEGERGKRGKNGERKGRRGREEGTAEGGKEREKERELKTFPGKQKLREFITTRPAYKKY